MASNDNRDTVNDSSSGNTAASNGNTATVSDSPMENTANYTTNSENTDGSKLQLRGSHSIPPRLRRPQERSYWDSLPRPSFWDPQPKGYVYDSNEEYVKSCPKLVTNPNLPLLELGTISMKRQMSSGCCSGLKISRRTYKTIGDQKI